jgi:hypothetical protein
MNPIIITKKGVKRFQEKKITQKGKDRNKSKKQQID